MRTRTGIPLPFLPAVLAVLASLLLAGVALAAPVSLTATLEGGDAEVPPGDPDGSGTAAITIDADTREVCWELTTTNIADATASHIHTGAAGVSGGVVVPLDVDGFSGSSEGCAAAPDEADLDAILASPADFYVNIHTEDYAPGAIRGQLAAAGGTPPDTAVPSAEGSPLVAAGIVLLLLAVAGGLRAARVRA
jgi:hypothetical protein